MATQLYETLGLSRDASAEQVRKAYRKKALDTHPDRLPPGASAADKSTSEELFRKVNNAYEVLSDPQKREVYDRYGVFPPPTQEQEISGSRQRRQTRHDPFSGPFFQDPFSMGGFGSGFGFGNSSGNPFHHNTAGFTDPFVLFESIFGNLDRAFRDPFFGDPFSPPGFGQGMFNSSMPPFGSPFGFVGGNSWSGASMSGNNGNGMRWISESRSSRTVNGVTESKWIRKDSSGNEHITYTYADGTQRTTINGIDQARADNGRIAGADGGGTTPAEPRQPDDHHSRRLIHAPSNHHRERRRARDAERAQTMDYAHARPERSRARTYDEGYAPMDVDQSSGAYSNRREFPHNSASARTYPNVPSSSHGGERTRGYNNGSSGGHNNAPAGGIYPDVRAPVPEYSGAHRRDEHPADAGEQTRGYDVGRTRGLNNTSAGGVYPDVRAPGPEYSGVHRRDGHPADANPSWKFWRN